MLQKWLTVSLEIVHIIIRARYVQHLRSTQTVGSLSPISVEPQYNIKDSNIGLRNMHLTQCNHSSDCILSRVTLADPLHKADTPQYIWRSIHPSAKCARQRYIIHIAYEGSDFQIRRYRLSNCDLIFGWVKIDGGRFGAPGSLLLIPGLTATMFRWFILRYEGWNDRYRIYRSVIRFWASLDLSNLLMKILPWHLSRRKDMNWYVQVRKCILSTHRQARNSNTNI